MPPPPYTQVIWGKAFMTASIFSHCSKLLPLKHKILTVRNRQLQTLPFTCASFDTFPYKTFAAHIGYTNGCISMEAWGMPHFMSESYSHSIVMKPNSYPLISHGMHTKTKSLAWTKWGKFHGKEKSTFPLPWFLICPQPLPPLLLWGVRKGGGQQKSSLVGFCPNPKCEKPSYYCWNPRQ